MVWDKVGVSNTSRPARGRVWARLRMGEEDLDQIRQHDANSDKHLHLSGSNLDDEGMAIARIER